MNCSSFWFGIPIASLRAQRVPGARICRAEVDLGQAENPGRRRLAHQIERVWGKQKWGRFWRGSNRVAGVGVMVQARMGCLASPDRPGSEATEANEAKIPASVPAASEEPELLSPPCVPEVEHASTIHTMLVGTAEKYNLAMGTSQQAEGLGSNLLSVRLIGPDGRRRLAMAEALASSPCQISDQMASYPDLDLAAADSGRYGHHRPGRRCGAGAGVGGNRFAPACPRR